MDLQLLEQLSNSLLLIPTLVIFFVGIVLSFKMRFVQFRGIPKMLSLATEKESIGKDSNTINPMQALFTAMSTTIGVGTIVAPIIAIQLGGPGALVGFLLSTVLGCAINFTEVTLALKFRKILPDGTVMGGPMEYLKDGLHPFIANWYSFSGVTMLLVWTSMQSNTVADLLSSYAVPRPLSGVVLAVLVTLALMGGIQRIGYISEKMVPFMLILYISAMTFIIAMNAGKLPDVLLLIFREAFSPKALLSGAATNSALRALRWGIFRGMQANEAGIGTGTIPHSMAQTDNPTSQGLLAMLSIYAQGVISILSGLVVMLTGTWTDPSITIGINVINKSFLMYFSHTGSLVLITTAILFSYGTVLGNSYNGSVCFRYITNNRFISVYNLLTITMILLGTTIGVKFLWLIVDFFLIAVALPHIIGILILAFKKNEIFRIGS